MSEKITFTMINALSHFQRKYRFLRLEVDLINKQIVFYKDVLMSMVNNLSYLNNYNIFDSTESHNLVILNEVKQIKKLLDEFNEKLKIKDLVNNQNKWSVKLLEVNQLLIKYVNHISPENITYILKLFGCGWTENFTEDDFEKIMFISRFFKPICVWYSKEHKKKIPLDKKGLQPKKKSSMITKDILTTLMQGKTGNFSSVIIGDSTLPSFLKSINDVVGKSTNKRKEIERSNHFSKLECSSILKSKNIIICKNKKSISLIEDKYGACVYIRFGNDYVVIQGLFKDDLLDISKTNEFVKEKYNSHKGTLNYVVLLVPKLFKENYLKTLNLRDIMVSTSSELSEDIRKKYNDLKILQGKPLLTLINEFLLASKYRKIDILSLLLMCGDDEQKLAFVLYDIFKSKDKKGHAIEIFNSLHYSIRNLLDNAKKLVEEDEKKLGKLSSSDIPYERRISMLKSNEDVKGKAMAKLKSIKSSFQGDNKSQSWLDGLLKIPFGVFKENSLMSFKTRFIEKLKLTNEELELFSDKQVSDHIDTLRNITDSNKLVNEWDEYKVNKSKYLKGVRGALDKAVYGHKEAKLQLERIFAQWINGESKGAIIGLQGPPGTGKTSLAKNGLSQCLQGDDGKSRPFVFLPIGGSVNGSTLVGHNFTYVGSTWGRIVDSLITSECMNPIIFIDEIDKVSHTEHGREIISILTHLTDLTQNDEFEDKYFAGIKFDLSKALIVFSFNDISLIDPILRDRITIIDTKPLTNQEKIVIIQKYMLPEILRDVGFSEGEIVFSDEMIRFLIDIYTNEAGVRKIKEKVIEIVRDINLRRFHDESVLIPFQVTKKYVELLFENKPKVRIKKHAPVPSVGLVNGLYATMTGIGGLTVIQAMKYPADKMLELSLTGKQGDVMKESVNYAVKIAFSLLPQEKQQQIIEDAQNKKAFGLHIHTPEAAVPKDGPSAGAAMTLAIYSLLTGKKVNNKVALTGEIDLCKNVTAIGGVCAKLNGAKRAGITKALIPQENMEDLERLRREGISPEDDTFEVFGIETIEQVLEHCLVDEDTTETNTDTLIEL